MDIRVVEAIREQAGELMHCSNLYRIRSQALLAQRLSGTVVGEPGKSFFCNSGAEANDALVKLARKYGHAAPGNEGPRTEIITLSNSFHGRTLGGIAATAQPKVKEGFDPMLPGFIHVPYNDLAAVKAALTSRTVAVLLEAVQGEGGINVAQPAYLKGLAKLCREYGLLLMFDEVQCGIGRAGDWCGWKAVLGGKSGDVIPDAVSWAKGLGGGFPIGAIWVRERPVATLNGEVALCDVLGPGTHGSTYGGNPLACAAALAVIDEIESANLCAHSRDLGAAIRKEIERWRSPMVREVRGLGLMIGVELDEEALGRHDGFGSAGLSPSLFVILRLMERGLLTIGAGSNVVRLLPPLNVSEDETNQALAVLHDVLRGIESEISPASS